ncbi:hypothetical protein FACS1894208_05410 [Clostridia bacterium]|nr:hypothetical protein FACS1894208_05410 [Clostridia bacterium]
MNNQTFTTAQIKKALGDKGYTVFPCWYDIARFLSPKGVDKISEAVSEFENYDIAEVQTVAPVTDAEMEALYETAVQSFNGDLFLERVKFVVSENTSIMMNCQTIDSFRVFTVSALLLESSPKPFIVANVLIGNRSKIIILQYDRLDYIRILFEFFYLNYRCLNTRINVEELPEKIYKTGVNKKKDTKRTRKVIYKRRHFKITFTENRTPKTFSRKTETWGVCGHYRHYKDGKSVFIKPYTKGNKDSTTAPRLYKV